VVVIVDGDVNVDLDAIVDQGVDVKPSWYPSKGTVNVQVAVYVYDHVIVKEH